MPLSLLSIGWIGEVSGTEWQKLKMQQSQFFSPDHVTMISLGVCIAQKTGYLSERLQVEANANTKYLFSES